MKTTIATVFAFLMMMGSVYAGGPGNPRPGANPAPSTTPAPPTAPAPPAPPAPAPSPRPGSNPGGTSAPAPVPHEVKDPKHKHGNKNGWYKNTHNPHNPHCDNPGHAKNKVK